MKKKLHTQDYTKMPNSEFLEKFPGWISIYDFMCDIFSNFLILHILTNPAKLQPSPQSKMNHAQTITEHIKSLIISIQRSLNIKKKITPKNY